MKPREPLPPAEITLDKSNGAKPLNEQIYGQILGLIESGRLQPGDRLPSTRTMAQELGVGRITAAAAFRRLSEEGWLIPAVGRGTVVADRLPSRTPRNSRPVRQEATEASHPMNEAARIAAAATAYRPQKLQPFAVICPDYDSLPGRKWTQIVARYSKNPWLHNSYCEPGGHPLFRRAIADEVRKSRGIVCSPEQVIVTCGIQQGLTMCARILFASGERVAMEDPCFELHRALVAYNSLVPVPVPVEADGIRVSSLRAMESAPKAVIVTPSHQYPTCALLSHAKRAELLAWARETEGWIIEDDYDGELCYSGAPYPALASIDPGLENTIYLGSFTKTIYPGFNLGYLIAPKSMAKAFEGAKLLCDRHASEVHQTILGQFIAEGFYEAHVRRIKKLYGERRSALLAAIRRYFQGIARVLPSAQGTHLALQFLEDCDDVELARRLAARGIEVRALSACYWGGGKVRCGLILGFAGLPEAEIDVAAEKLATGVREFLGLES